MTIRTEATVRVDIDTRADTLVESMLFGKFCEHLGNNIHHGMDAQILINPTFGGVALPRQRASTGPASGTRDYQP